MKKSLAGCCGFLVSGFAFWLFVGCAGSPPAAEAELEAASPAEQSVAAGAAAMKMEEAPAAKAAAEPLGPAAPPPQTAAAAPSEPPPVEAGTTRYLSADDSNSAASPVIARKLIRSGRIVPPALVRTYEFLNYHFFDYPSPAGAPVAIYAGMRPAEQAGEYSLQAAVRSRDRALADLPPLNLTVLLDVSGSMAGPPFQLAKTLVQGIAGRLRAGDRLSLVTCAREARVLLEGHPVGGGTAAAVAAILAGLAPNDVTDLGRGVTGAYAVAMKTYDYRFLSRVVVISDGADNVSPEAEAAIAKNAEDSDRQGIYLAGIGVGEGFNDQLMNRFTDKGRGAYLFVDSPTEVERLLAEPNFVAAFDLAVKNVRLKMVLPPGWRMTQFHGEQVSERAADVVPQYLAAGDQMIYHLVVAVDRPDEAALRQPFQFEVEYTPLPGRPSTLAAAFTPAEMLARQREVRKGDAVVAFAEMLKAVRAPLEEHRADNLEALDRAAAVLAGAARELQDPELAALSSLAEDYRGILERGEQFPGSRDGQSAAPEAALGLKPTEVRKVALKGRNTGEAVKAISRLGASTRLVPLEGYRFLALSSGPVGNPSPADSGELDGTPARDPRPEYLGRRRAAADDRPVFDLHQVVLELKAPPGAKSFSFDFNFFSAEYPEYVQQNFNDTFYAILEASSTNGGRATNIAFDATGSSIEVDNNYFQQPFHPIPNTGTGFDRHGSTGWLRTSWPIRGGEEFRLTFSIHDEGDAVFDSLVLLDNFRWHEYEAVGATDPLN